MFYQEACTCSFERLRIEHRPDGRLQHVHHEHRTHHPPVPKRGPPVEPGHPALPPQHRRGLPQRPEPRPCQVPLHTGLDGVERLREVAREKSAQQGGGDARLGGGVEGGGEPLLELAADDGRDGEVPDRPEPLADRTADEAAGDGGGGGHIFEGLEEGAPLALLLDHDELQRTPDGGADHPRRQPAPHLLVRAQRPPLAAHGGALEAAPDCELDHGAGAHVDHVGEDAAVELGGIHGQGFALLEHHLAVVEGLEARHLHHSHTHAHRGVLELVQLRRHPAS
mmetsp:Transcript_45437/g.88770  ORF Transcript_45437/g.88770 Transcript_45437/m.88770 type:complete len:281 (+) Transcript_45437:94-936(+)